MIHRLWPATAGRRTRPDLWAWALRSGALAGVLVLALGAVARAGYRYGGYTPLHEHAGERAVVDAPRCRIRLVNAADHDAAYVDVSNDKATIWGQAGWWLGTAGNGHVFASPVGYIEYRLSDGTYLWKSLGPPPPGARYSVTNSGLTMHDAAGHAMPLYRITASFVAGTLATYPYPARTGDNAGLAESYSTGGVLEPIGPAAYGSIELAWGGRWRRWRPAVDGADRTIPAGDRLTLGRRWYRWQVEGHLRYTPAATAAPYSPIRVRARRAPSARWPRRQDSGGWRLFAPAALWRPGGAVELGALTSDALGRLVGTGLDADGHLLLWRWRPTPSAGRGAEVWHLADLRAALGSGQSPGWAALPDGGAAYAAGADVLWLPAGRGPVRETALGPGGPAVAAAAGPHGSVAILRPKGPTLELWRPPPQGTDRPWRRLFLGPAAGRPDAMAYLGGGRWLLSRPDSAGGAYARLTEVDLGEGERPPSLHTVSVPGLNLAAAAGTVAIDGGDRSRGVRVQVGRGGAWRSPAALAWPAAWGDAVTVGLDGRVWAGARHAGATVLIGWRRGAPLARLALPPLWVEENPPLARHEASQREPSVAAPPYGVSLAAGRGWVAAAPAGQAAVFVACDRSRPRPPRARAAP